jgi:hypothetical protein
VGTDFENALLFERPFIPISLFKASFVKEALNAGRSFAAIMIDNEYATLPNSINRYVRKLMTIFKIRPPLCFRKRYFTSYPKRVYYDTGAKIYEYLRYERFFFFASLPRPCISKYVNHFHGATRTIINPNDKQIGNSVHNINDIIISRLQSEYNELVL